MPCSRSARRPSVRSARFTYPSPRRSDVSSTCSSWSSKMDFVSYSSRPISVDLPSSTDPAVANRTSSEVRCLTGLPFVAAPGATLEVALLLAVLHRGLGHAVVSARLTALGDPGGRDLGNDVLE